MGTVIRFPEERRSAMRAAAGSVSSWGTDGAPSVVILPVIRIERHEEGVPEPEAGSRGGGRGRRSGRRS